MMAFKNSYEGEGKWWNSEDYDIDLNIRSQWRQDLNEWRDGRPTWDTWSVEM